MIIYCAHSYMQYICVCYFFLPLPLKPSQACVCSAESCEREDGEGEWQSHRALSSQHFSDEGEIK